MSFLIAPFAGQSYPSRYADHRDIRAYLGLGKLVEKRFGDGRPYVTIEAEKMPTDFEGVWPDIPLTDGRTTRLYAYRGHRSTCGARGKRSTHRVFAKCPDCGAEVPAGRTHQHKCK